MKALHYILITLTSIFFSTCAGNRESLRDTMLSIQLDGYIQACGWRPVLSVKDQGEWQPVADPFDSGKQPICYVDDHFQAGGCDYGECRKISESLWVQLVEYVQVGTKEAPLHSGITPGIMFPMYKIVPLHGEIKVRFSYFADSTCSNEKTFTATFSR